MDWLEVAMRAAADDGRPRFLARVFKGGPWEESEKAALHAIFDKYGEPTMVPSTYNNWVCRVYRDGLTAPVYEVGRATWEFGHFVGDLNTVCEKLAAWYERRIHHD